MEKTLTEYRVVIERPLEPRESRVMREEKVTNLAGAIEAAVYWHSMQGAYPDGTQGWVERRTVSLWEDFYPESNIA
jgi:hypothetical protein